MAGGTNVAVSTYSGTISAAGTAEVTTFTARYGYVVVENTGTTGNLYVTADGTTPTGSGAGSGVAVTPGQSVVIANGVPLWTQVSTVIPAGKVIYPTGGGTPQTNTTANGQPGEVQPFQSSLQGKVANPGTTVSVLSPVGTPTYTISGTG